LDLNFDLQSLRTQMRALSHDVRSPISGIISMSEVLQEQIVEEESKEELLESSRMIELSGKELLVLTEEILQSENYLNKIDQREGNDWNLDVLQKKLFALYHPQAQKKEIELKIDIKEEGGQFFSKDSLLQIAGNLIANSIKFTDKDGSIRVTLSIVKLNNQTILSILVKDNGVGMDASQVELLHSKEKNCQSKPGTNQEKGYGYGLQLVKELLDQRSGQWRIVSAPGDGTEITVQIPIQ
jgi:signal transduction histidine kinase